MRGRGVGRRQRPRRGMAIAERPAGAGWSPLRGVSGGHRYLPYLFDEGRNCSRCSLRAGARRSPGSRAATSGHWFRSPRRGTSAARWGRRRALVPVRDVTRRPRYSTPQGTRRWCWEERFGSSARATRPRRAARHRPAERDRELSARHPRHRPVRCSKARDAGVEPRDGSSEARAIRANRTSTVRLRIERKRRVRVTLVVADRAGHTQRWTQRCAYAEPPVRTLLVLALLLLTAAPARAEGFAPADPLPPVDGHCVAAAGDVIAVGRSVREGWVIEASVAGGPWERVLGAPLRGDVGGCPSVAAATTAPRSSRAATRSHGSRSALPEGASVPPRNSGGPTTTWPSRPPAADRSWPHGPSSRTPHSRAR